MNKSILTLTLLSSFIVLQTHGSEKLNAIQKMKAMMAGKPLMPNVATTPLHSSAVESTPPPQSPTQNSVPISTPTTPVVLVPMNGVVVQSPPAVTTLLNPRVPIKPVLSMDLSLPDDQLSFTSSTVRILSPQTPPCIASFPPVILSEPYSSAAVVRQCSPRFDSQHAAYVDEIRFMRNLLEEQRTAFEEERQRLLFRTEELEVAATKAESEVMELHQKLRLKEKECEALGATRKTTGGIHSAPMLKPTGHKRNSMTLPKNGSQVQLLQQKFESGDVNAQEREKELLERIRQLTEEKDQLNAEKESVKEAHAELTKAYEEAGIYHQNVRPMEISMAILQHDESVMKLLLPYVGNDVHFLTEAVRILISKVEGGQKE